MTGFESHGRISQTKDNSGGSRNGVEQTGTNGIAGQVGRTRGCRTGGAMVTEGTRWDCSNKRCHSCTVQERAGSHGISRQRDRTCAHGYEIPPKTTSNRSGPQTQKYPKVLGPSTKNNRKFKRRLLIHHPQLSGVLENHRLASALAGPTDAVARKIGTGASIRRKCVIALGPVTTRSVI